MKLFGYEHNNNKPEDATQVLELEEASIECSIEEFEAILSFLKKEYSLLVQWSGSRDKSLEISSSDYAELQIPSNFDHVRIQIMVSLKSVVDKYGH